MANTINFTRGDAITHTFSMPASAWSPGGKLWFVAKPTVDDDNTDAAAVIKKSWTDSAVSDTTINGVAYKQYACSFVPADTNSILSNGAQSAQYLGEFQWEDSTGVPITFPATDPKLNCTVYFDIARGL
jgi:hypothetical protein